MRKKFYYGALALGLLFTGCSSDELIESAAPTVSDADQTFYVGMTIRGDVTSGTRTAAEDGDPFDPADFEAGTGDENKVNNCYFVFYDESGNVVGDIVHIELATLKEVTEEVGATVEKCYKSVVPVSVRKGEKIPTGVICYINPISPSSLQNPLNVIQTRTREMVTTKSGEDMLFAMSNSVYYKEDAPQPQIVAEISENCLKHSESEASDPANEDIVDIYVERYATKLSFKAADPTTYKTSTRVYGENATTYTTQLVELDFVPQYWALNGESKTSYVIKSFREESENGQIMANNYTFSLLNEKINDGLADTKAWKWNNAVYNRSYWSISPAYFTSKYPEVSSDVATTDLNQTYLSYAELGNKGFVAGNTNAQYFKETTVGTKALTSNNPAAAMASVIYVGQYKMKINHLEQEETPNFYTYLSGQVKDNDVAVDGVEGDRPFVYFDNELNSVKSTVKGTSSMLHRFLAQATILFKKNAEGKFERYSIADAADVTKLAAALEVAEIKDKVKAVIGDGNPLKLQANVRSLQFKSETAAAGIYVVTANGYMEVVADGAVIEKDADQIHFSEANATLMQQVGYAYYYHQGKSYFNIPVKHYGWYRAGNEQKNANKIDWSIVRVGDFGMVRNHSYSVNVSEITGLASGISGDDVPIVPPATTDEYYMAYTVRILKWAVVPTQNVKL